MAFAYTKKFLTIKWFRLISTSQYSKIHHGPVMLTPLYRKHNFKVFIISQNSVGKL